MTIMILSILIGFLIKQYNDMFDIQLAYLNIFKTLVHQGCNYFTNFQKLITIYSNRYSIIIIILTWLFMASFITRSFSSLLLKTYFNIKSMPVVNTLQDVADNEHANIITDARTIAKLLISNHTQQFHVVLKQIFYRHFKYAKIVDKGININNYNDLYNFYILENIIKGKVIIVINDFIAGRFQGLFVIYNDKFTISKYKYFQNYWFYIIPKYSDYYKEFKFM